MKNDRFFTSENARQAVMIAASALQQMATLKIPNKEPQGYFVVFDARLPYNPMRPTADYVLFQEPLNQHLWPDKHYDRVAYAKAILSYRTRMNTWRVITQFPELLLPSDVRYGGGVFIEPGIVVAFSGLQWWVDEWVSTLAANSLHYIAAEAARQELADLESRGGAFLNA